MEGMAFGAFFQKLRLRLGKTLREFCLENGFDPGNLSKMERGMLPPPQSRQKLEEYARALQLVDGSDDWYEFFDLASISAGRIPDDVMSEEDIVARLPLLFRSLRGQEIDDERLTKLIELIRRA